MRREHKRHPFFESLVFGMALLLAVILLFHGGRTMLRLRAESRAAPRPSADVVATVLPPEAELPHELDVEPTERGVNKLPPVAVSRVSRPSRRTTEVPLPR